MSHHPTCSQLTSPERSSARSFTLVLSLMESFFNTIDYQAHSPGASQDRQSTPSHSGGGGETDSPPHPSRSATPNMDEDPHRNNPDCDTSRQLQEYAVASARHDRLSATGEERLVEFTQVASHVYPIFRALTTPNSSPQIKCSSTYVQMYLALNNR